MRAKPGLYVEWIDDEAVVLDTSANRLHYLNPSAALVYALIQEFGLHEALKRVAESYSDRDVIENEVPRLIEDMLDRGLLTDD